MLRFAVMSFVLWLALFPLKTFVVFTSWNKLKHNLAVNTALSQPLSALYSSSAGHLCVLDVFGQCLQCFCRNTDLNQLPVAVLPELCLFFCLPCAWGRFQGMLCRKFQWQSCSVELSGMLGPGSETL